MQFIMGKKLVKLRYRSTGPDTRVFSSQNGAASLDYVCESKIYFFWG